MIASTLVSCGFVDGVKNLIEQNINTNTDSSVMSSNTSTDTSVNTNTSTGNGGADQAPDVEEGTGTDDVLVQVLSMGTPVTVSDNVEDYVGNLEVFTYGLLVNGLEGLYSVFPASVALSTLEVIYGLAYTDYSEVYVDEELGINYISSGFLPLIGELTISEEEFNTGLIITDLLAVEEEEYQYVFTYGSDPFADHCVVFDQYLKYGVNDEGQIYYESTPYLRGECDETLGTLYSYDEERVVFDVDFGEYTPITGESLSEAIDYDAVVKQLDEIIAEQDRSLLQIDIETEIYIAHEAVDSFLLSFQEETFLGFRIEDLIYASSQLDPKTCLRINEKGILDVEILDVPPKTPSEATKWLVGSFCVINVIAATILTYAPYTSTVAPLWGAISGATIEIFIQTVIENHTLKDFQWGKIAMSAATGAATAYLGPILQNYLKGAAYAVTDTAIDSIMGGIEYASYAWMEGASGKEIASEALKGVAYGLAFSGGIKIIGSALGAAKKAAPSLAKKVAPKLVAKVSDMAGTVVQGARNTISKAKSALVKKLDDLYEIRAHKLLAKRASNLIDTSVVPDAQQVVKRNLKKLKDKMLNDSIDEITMKYDIFDIKTQKKLIFQTVDAKRQFYKNAPDGVLGTIISNKNAGYIVKTGSVITFVGDPTIYQSVISDITPNRGITLKNAAGKFKAMWTKNVNKMPKDIADLIMEEFPEEKDLRKILQQISDSKMYEIIQKSKWTLHELPDLKTVQLIDTEFHQSLSHLGGKSYAEQIVSIIGMNGYKKILEISKNMIK